AAWALTVGGWSTSFTTIWVCAVPVSAFDAANVTPYGLDAAAVNPGVQVNVPEVFCALSGVNEAPGGRPLAVSEGIGCSSPPDTWTWIVCPSFTVNEGSTVATGGRSTLIVVVALPASTLPAVNVTA